MPTPQTAGQSEWTPEPWATAAQEVANGKWYVHAPGKGYGGRIVIASNLDEANARRIVACVNELAGKPEGYVAKLERDYENAVQHAAFQVLEGNKYREQRDELAAALRDLIAAVDDTDGDSIMALNRGRAALAALNT